MQHEWYYCITASPHLVSLERDTGIMVDLYKSLDPTHSEQAVVMNYQLLAITSTQVTHHLFDSHHSGPIGGE